MEIGKAMRACGELGTVLNNMAGNYIVLAIKLYGQDSKSNNYPIHRQLLFAMNGTVTFSATVFDPSLYTSPNVDKRRRRDQDGLVQNYHLLSVSEIEEDWILTSSQSGV